MNRTGKRHTEDVISPEMHDALIKAIREAVQEELHVMRKEVKDGYIPKAGINYYRMVECALSVYKPVQRTLANERAYVNVDFQARSKDIVSSLGSGAAASVSERIDELQAQRAIEYLTSEATAEKIARVIREYSSKEEFIVIRMYYFGEDKDGYDRQDNRPYTWDDIADEIGRDVKTVRRWKNRLINDMAATMYGANAIMAEAVHWAKRVNAHE